MSTGTIYRDEKIERPFDIPYGRIPGPIKGIRSLEGGFYARRQPREQLFKKQAVLMESYEDDQWYDHIKPQLFPTYETLRDIELRGYFTWRSYIRKGKRPVADLTCLLLYIFELINGIGVSDPADGFKKLIELRECYQDSCREAFRIYDRWLMHYAVYYRLPWEVLDGAVDFSRSVMQMKLIRSEDHTDGETGEILYDLLCAQYREELSKIASTASEDTIEEIKPMLGASFNAIKRVYGKHRKNTLNMDLFGNAKWMGAKLFSGAMFHDEGKPRTYDYEISEICKYRCVDGKWKVYEYEKGLLNNMELNDLLFSMLSQICDELGLEKFADDKVTKNWILKEITKSVAEVHKAHELELSRRVVIDFSKLDDIRRDSLKTGEKLLTEAELCDEPEIAEPEKEAVTLHAEPKAEVGAASETEPETESEAILTADEMRLLEVLIHDGDLSVLTSGGLMISVLCDSINEKLYDEFCDIVIEGDPPQLIEDYAPDIREMFGL